MKRGPGAAASAVVKSRGRTTAAAESEAAEMRAMLAADAAGALLDHAAVDKYVSILSFEFHAREAVVRNLEAERLLSTNVLPVTLALAGEVPLNSSTVKIIRHSNVEEPLEEAVEYLFLALARVLHESELGPARMNILEVRGGATVVPGANRIPATIVADGNALGFSMDSRVAHAQCTASGAPPKLVYQLVTANSKPITCKNPAMLCSATLQAPQLGLYPGQIPAVHVMIGLPLFSVAGAAPGDRPILFQLLHVMHG